MSAVKAASIPLASDRAKALALTPVSRETAERLDRFVDLLLAWQKTTNLISPATVPRLWTRHVADSLQLLALAPSAKVWVDFGSGGGFPGLPIACALAETPGVAVHLVESNGKKASFLREAARVTQALAIVHAVRGEKFVDSYAGPVDVIAARAVAPLNLLLSMTFPLLKEGVLGIFPKGQDVGTELTEATKYWNISYKVASSRTDPGGHIVIIDALARW